MNNDRINLGRRNDQGAPECQINLRNRIPITNEQPHLPNIILADTLEAQAAELISHYARREQELLEANNRYLEQARAAEYLLGLARDRENVMSVIAKSREARLAQLTQSKPDKTPLTATGLADALDAFWNASLNEASNRQTEVSRECASVMAEGISAVARQLRQGAPT